MSLSVNLSLKVINLHYAICTLLINKEEKEENLSCPLRPSEY